MAMGLVFADEMGHMSLPGGSTDLLFFALSPSWQSGKCVLTRQSGKTDWNAESPCETLALGHPPNLQQIWHEL